MNPFIFRAASARLPRANSSVDAGSQREDFSERAEIQHKQSISPGEIVSIIR